MAPLLAVRRGPARSASLRRPTAATTPGYRLAERARAKRAKHRRRQVGNPANRPRSLRNPAAPTPREAPGCVKPLANRLPLKHQKPGRLRGKDQTRRQSKRPHRESYHLRCNKHSTSRHRRSPIRLKRRPRSDSTRQQAERADRPKQRLPRPRHAPERREHSKRVPRQTARVIRWAHTIHS